MSKMLVAAERWHYADFPLADAAMKRAEKRRKKYGPKKPHGHHLPDVETVDGADYAIYGAGSGDHVDIYRIVWHEREGRATRYQLVRATAEEAAAVTGKRARAA